MSSIIKTLKNFLTGDIVYPVTKADAVYMANSTTATVENEITTLSEDLYSFKSTVLSTSEDLNDIIKEGLYYITTSHTISNTPQGAVSPFTMLVFKKGVTMANQLVILNNRKMYYRIKYPDDQGGWQPWYLLLASETPETSLIKIPSAAATCSLPLAANGTNSISLSSLNLTIPSGYKMIGFSYLNTNATGVVLRGSGAVSNVSTACAWFRNVTSSATTATVNARPLFVKDDFVNSY